MALAREERASGSTYLSEVKLLAGRRVEQERRSRGISQVQLGARAGLGPAWIRQMESGYPKVRLDDHLACFDVLKISPLVMLIPILFLLHGRHYPPHLLLGDLRRLEDALIDFIINWNVTDLRDAMLPTPPIRADDPVAESD
jgi:transcriptional regulator with XRE-family HTH domain